MDLDATYYALKVSQIEIRVSMSIVTNLGAGRWMVAGCEEDATGGWWERQRVERDAYTGANSGDAGMLANTAVVYDI